MKYRNNTEDARDIPALGITVEPGETTPELSRDEAKGFVGQVDVWTAVGSEDRTKQKRAVAKQAAAGPVEPVVDERNI